MIEMFQAFHAVKQLTYMLNLETEPGLAWMAWLSGWFCAPTIFWGLAGVYFSFLKVTSNSLIAQLRTSQPNSRKINQVSGCR